MKVIIAGSRSIAEYELIEIAVAKSAFQVTEVISGGARGVDKLGERYAEENGLPITQFFPDWKRLGRSAGLRRNEEMVSYAEAAIVLWDGSSRGARHLISIANANSLPCYVSLVIRDSL